MSIINWACVLEQVDAIYNAHDSVSIIIATTIIKF